MLHHPGSSLRFPTKEGSRARSPTIPHRAHLGTAGGPAARKGEEPSAGLPPSPHPRQGGLREAGAGLGLRLRQEYIESQVQERFEAEVEALVDLLEAKLTREEFVKVARM